MTANESKQAGASVSAEQFQASRIVFDGCTTDGEQRWFHAYPLDAHSY